MILSFKRIKKGADQTAGMRRLVYPFVIDRFSSVKAQLYGPLSSKRYKLGCASIGDSDQFAHPRSLTRLIGGLSMGSQAPNVSLGGSPNDSDLTV